jgi:hypothetical protein
LRRLLLSFEDVLEPVLQRKELDRMLDGRQSPADADGERVTPLPDAAYVENAGLVLLAGFLPRFFERLGLLDARGLIAGAFLPKAVSLLQYLASGDPRIAGEYLLPLNKVICGMEPVEPIIIDEPLGESDMEEAETLLRALIGHATILNNMSSDGFRGSFLLRKGVLESTHGAWLLRVERQAYDVVLDRFPWSFSWIKTSWMTTPLRVEW